MIWIWLKIRALVFPLQTGYDELKSVAKYITKNPVETGGFAEAVYKFIEF